MKTPPLYDYVKGVCVRQGVTLREFAAQWGVKEDSQHHKLKGRRMLRLEEAVRLSAALNALGENIGMEEVSRLASESRQLHDRQTRQKQRRSR